MAEKTAQIIQVRSRESFVHRFHGDGGPREIEIFEEEIRHAWADDLSITASQKVAVIRRYLGSAVKDELACYPAELIADPEKLLATLRRAYGESKSVSRLTLELHQCRQGRNEGLRMYSQRIRRKFLTLKSRQRDSDQREANDTDLRDIFIDGILDEGLKLHLRQRRLEQPSCSFFDVREIALKLCEDSGESVEINSISCPIEEKGNNAVTRHQRGATLDLEDRLKRLEENKNEMKTDIDDIRKKIEEINLGNQEMLQKILEKLEKPSQVEPNRSERLINTANRNGTCFLCGKRGHFARECRERINAASRQESDRTQHVVRSQSVGVKSGGSMPQAFGKCPTVQAFIGSTPVQALLDTGSQVSIVSEQFCKTRLGSATPQISKSKSVCLTAANGTNLLHSGCFTTNLKVLGTTIKNSIIFVTKDLDRTNCILGMNVLKHLPMFADCVKVTAKRKRKKRTVKGDETSKKSLRTKAESRIVENNKRGDQSRRLYIGDKVLLLQHPPGRNKIQPRYQDNMFAVASAPEIGGTYVVKDDVTQQTRVVAGTEMRRYLPRVAADVVVDPAAGERDDFTAEADGDPAVGVDDNRPADVDVDPAVGRVTDRAADVGVNPAVLVGADGAAHVGVGRTMDEAARADVAADGDVEPTTRKPTPGECGDGDRLGEMTYIVQMPAPSVESFPASQPEMTSCDESIGDSHRRSRIPVRLGSPVLASPQLPDKVRREQSRIPVRQSPMEPVQPRQVDASRDRMSSTQRTRMELRRSSRLAQRKN